MGHIGPTASLRTHKQKVRQDAAKRAIFMALAAFFASAVGKFRVFPECKSLQYKVLYTL
jgi:hypothetical protein